MFCKHDWELKNEATTESKFEHALKQCKKAGVTNKFTLSGQMCDAERKYIQVFACRKCGKLKKFVDTI